MSLLDDVMPQTGGNPDSLFSQVAGRIAVAIVSGDVGPGELIPNEAAVGSKVPVSRSVYREAVKYLSGKGLIEARPKSGTRAAPASAWNLLDTDVLRWSLEAGANEKFINDLFELRSFIEPNVARLAALRRTDDEAQTILRAYQGMATTAPCTPQNIRHDLDFHEAIIDACGNQALKCLKSVVMTTLMWVLQLQHGKTAEDFGPALADHKRVAEAILARDGAQAAAVMTVLVNDSLAETLVMFRSRREQRGYRAAAE